MPNTTNTTNNHKRKNSNHLSSFSHQSHRSSGLIIDDSKGDINDFKRKIKYTNDLNSTRAVNEMRSQRGGLKNSSSNNGNKLSDSAFLN